MFRIPDLPSGPTRRPGQPTPRTDVPSIGIPRDVFSSLPLLTTPRPRLSICWLQNEKTLIFNKKRWYSTKNAYLSPRVGCKCFFLFRYVYTKICLFPENSGIRRWRTCNLKSLICIHIWGTAIIILYTDIIILISDLISS